MVLPLWAPALQFCYGKLLKNLLWSCFLCTEFLFLKGERCPGLSDCFLFRRSTCSPAHCRPHHSLWFYTQQGTFIFISYVALACNRVISISWDQAGEYGIHCSSDLEEEKSFFLNVEQICVSRKERCSLKLANASKEHTPSLRLMSVPSLLSGILFLLRLMSWQSQTSVFDPAVLGNSHSTLLASPPLYGCCLPPPFGFSASHLEQKWQILLVEKWYSECAPYHNEVPFLSYCSHKSWLPWHFCCAFKRVCVCVYVSYLEFYLLLVRCAVPPELETEFLTCTFF